MQSSVVQINVKEVKIAFNLVKVAEEARLVELFQSAPAIGMESISPQDYQFEAKMISFSAISLQGK